MIPTQEAILQLVGKQPYKESMLIDDQDTDDIIEAILNKHESCEADYDKFAYLFDGGTTLDICERLFDFCKEHLAYVVETTKRQYVSKPGTMLRRGHADCKGYALFCGGVLDALKRSGKKINWDFRFASYNLFNRKPYHVFIVVHYQGHEVFVDPVFNKFGYRKPAIWIEDYKMSAPTAKIAGMCCDAKGRLNVMSDGETAIMQTGSRVGATGQQVGQTMM
jgi:hypothetical protein